MRTLLVALGVVLLASCAGPKPQPGVSTAPLGALSTLSIDAAETAIAERLAGLGFAVEERGANAIVLARIDEGAPAEWSICDRVEVRDLDGGIRFDWAEAKDRRTSVTARFSELGGRTAVVLKPRFEGIYTNSFDNLPFARACASTGTLETLLLAAVHSPEGR